MPWGPAKQWAVQPLAVNGKGCYVGLYVSTTPPPPAIGVTIAGPAQLPVGMTGAYNAVVTGVPSGAMANISWGYGDGSAGTGPNTIHAYAAPGQYTVSCMVSVPSTGQAARAVLGVTVTGAPPAGLTIARLTALLSDGSSRQVYP